MFTYTLYAYTRTLPDFLTQLFPKNNIFTPQQVTWMLQQQAK